MSGERLDCDVQTPGLLGNFSADRGSSVARPLFGTPVDGSLQNSQDDSAASEAVGSGERAAGYNYDVVQDGFLAPFEVEEALGLPSPEKDSSLVRCGDNRSLHEDSVASHRRIESATARNGRSRGTSAAASWARISSYV